MKNINLKIHESLSFKSSIILAFMMCFICTSHLSYATIIAPATQPSQTLMASTCASAASGAIQSQADDIAQLQAAYSSDCMTSPLTITYLNEGVTGSSTDCSWEYIRNYTINEDNGQACNDVIVVAFEHFGGDTSPPTGSSTYSAPVTNGCISDAPDFDATNALMGFSDNCAGSLMATLTGTTPGASNSDCSWSFTYDYTVTDFCSNTPIAGSYTVSGGDMTGPSGSSTYSAPFTDGCMSDAPVFNAAHALVGFNDCTANMTVTFNTTTLGPSNSDCNWSFTYNYTVFDDCNNPTAGSYTVSGGDVTGPTGSSTYSALFTDGCMSDAPAFTIANALVGFSDNCTADMNITANLNGTIINGDDCEWTVTYYYFLSDVCSNTSSQITYEEYGSDTEAPKLMGTAYSDMTAMHNYCLFTTTTIPMPLEFDQMRALQGYTDDCSAPTDITATLTNTSITGSSCGPSGWELKYTYDVEDKCGNIFADQSYSHKGKNTTGPSFGNLSQNQDATFPSSSQTCDQDLQIVNPSATDKCGTNVPSTMSISAMDPDGNNTFVFNPNVLTGDPDFWLATFPVGTSIVTITATDACGVTSIHNYSITVEDISPPYFGGPGTGGCPSSITPSGLGCDNDISFTIQADDNCNGNSVTVDVAFSGNAIVPSGITGVSGGATIVETYFQGITTVRLTATNPDGLSNTCSFTVTADPSCGYLNPCTPFTEVDTDDLDPVNIGGTVAVFRSDNYTTSSDPTTSSVFTANPDDPHTIVPSGHNVAFYGGNEVRLLEGFEVQLGATFLADIAPCNP